MGKSEKEIQAETLELYEKDYKKRMAEIEARNMMDMEEFDILAIVMDDDGLPEPDAYLIHKAEVEFFIAYYVNSNDVVYFMNTGTGEGERQHIY